MHAIVTVKGELFEKIRNMAIVRYTCNNAIAGLAKDPPAPEVANGVVHNRKSVAIRRWAGHHIAKLDIVESLRPVSQLHLHACHQEGSVA